MHYRLECPERSGQIPGAPDVAAADGKASGSVSFSLSRPAQRAMCSEYKKYNERYPAGLRRPAAECSAAKYGYGVWFTRHNRFENGRDISHPAGQAAGITEKIIDGRRAKGRAAQDTGESDLLAKAYRRALWKKDRDILNQTKSRTRLAVKSRTT